MNKINAKIIKNFISQDEIRSLNKWTLLNYTNEYFYDANMDLFHERTRLTTRLANEVDYKKIGLEINYPQESYNIRKRIIETFGLQSYKSPNSFYDGIVNGIGFENGSICHHIDPIYYDGTETLHCNIITQKPLSGGITIINDYEFDAEEGDLLCYVVSKHYHEVTKIVGPKERILWVFGFCIDDNKIEQIFGH